MSLTVTPHSLSSNKTAALHPFATQGRLKGQIWGKSMAKRSTSADYTDAILKKNPTKSLGRARTFFLHQFEPLPVEFTHNVYKQPTFLLALNTASTHVFINTRD